MSWLDHPLHCECIECAAPDPRYAGKRGVARSLIERLSRRGVSFRLVGGKVRFRPTTLLTDEERFEIRRVKYEVCQLLREDEDLCQLLREDEDRRRTDEGNSPLSQVARFDLQDAG
jgi:hypothetical protein